MMPTLLIVMGDHRIDGRWTPGNRHLRALVWETSPIADLHLIPTGYERLLPPGVQLTVRTRRRALASRARGRVLDLGGADAHANLWEDHAAVDDVVSVRGAADPALIALARGDQGFDTIFSVFQLVSAPDLDATLGRLGRILAPDGRLLFIEPGRLVGVGGRSQRLVAPAVGLASKWHVERDIPVALRDAALSVISLDRHRVTTMQWWLSRIIEGVAHHAAPIARPGADRGSSHARPDDGAAEGK